MIKSLLSVALAAGLGLSASAAIAQTTTSATLDAVKAKGYVQCGVTGGVPGFSAPDANNNWTGLEVDYCRAIAAAVFNNADAVRYTPLTSQERFTALSAGEIDVLSRTTTWTMSRDTSSVSSSSAPCSMTARASWSVRPTTSLRRSILAAPPSASSPAPPPS
jgi:general L-amino acid transport system substrate-binding protein